MSGQTMPDRNSAGRQPGQTPSLESTLNPMDSAPEPEPDTLECKTSPRNDVEVGRRTHEGKVREKNEDSCLYFEPDQDDLFARKGRLLAIADGMGGHRAGEVASHVAVESLQGAYFLHPSEDPRVALGDAMVAANESIFQRAAENEEERGMGTTCTALVHRGEEVYIAHVGDSRAYLIRGRSSSQITEDHATPQGLLRALGAHPSVEVETRGPFQVRKEDAFVICSDGLTRYFDGTDIRNVLHGAKTAQEACDELVRRTLEEGAVDNVTVQILRIRDSGRRNRGQGERSASDTQPLPFFEDLEMESPSRKKRRWRAPLLFNRRSNLGLALLVLGILVATLLALVFI